MSAKLQECYSEVKQEDDERKFIVQQIMQKSTDFLMRIIVPVEGQGGSHCRTCALTIMSSRWKTATSCATKHGKQCNWWCAACGGQHRWRNPNGIFVLQDSSDRREARAHAPPQGVCENLVNAVKLLAGQLGGGSVVEGLQERRLKVTELRRHLVDNHGAVKVGELEKTSALSVEPTQRTSLKWCVQERMTR